MKNNKLAKSYNHEDIESSIYEWWEEHKFFQPETQRELGLVDDDSPRYCITLPLPNVTGILHLGHAITISLEDFMTRYHRMKQEETLFIPGTDHAGIATQNVVERELLKQGTNRRELGRKKFVERVWKWKHEYHARITKQSKSMGMSSDWSREAFTLDKERSKAVREAFYQLYHKGLIYRGEYLINWCPRCESAISDLECEPKEKESNLWYIKYPIVTENWQGPKNDWGSGNWADGAENYIIVATTRPETLVGDTAVATIEEHEEYGSLVGKTAVLPINGRKIPIIADEHVDAEFGTGALKITPAHDPDDFEIGQRHNLELITILDENAKMIPEYSGRYGGMDRYAARDEIVEDLQKEDLLLKTESYKHSEPHCQRCHTVIEPRISLQWFVKTGPLAEKAMNAVRNGKTTIIPEREEKRFFHWMENIHDWCISRQLWWGHQIPIWYCQDCQAQISPPPAVEEPTKCPECNSKNLIQEQDVLDTWFSSGLWPFSTLGWPNTDHPDFKRFFPTNTRETGYDILFFWVAREMMLSLEMTGNVPYKMVYLHGLIRDENGQKISKSMEDVDQYDPLHIIAQHGADSLRYVLIANSVPGLDMNLDPRQLDAAHHFCNKIWQSARFILSHIHEDDKLSKFKAIDKTKLQIADKWIMSRLNNLIEDVNTNIENYEFLKAAREIKNFYWNEFCDWYIEMTKIRLYGEDDTLKLAPKVVLLEVLEKTLKLLHPIMPHMTEKLWQNLPRHLKDGPALIVAQWPTANHNLIEKQLEKDMVIILDFIRDVRRVRAEFHVPASAEVQLFVNVDQDLPLLEKLAAEITTLAKVDPDSYIIGSDLDIPKKSARIVKQYLTGYIPLSHLIDMERESKRIQKRLENTNEYIQNVEKKLDSPFSEKAPEEIVQKEKNKLEELQKKRDQLLEQLNIFKE